MRAIALAAVALLSACDGRSADPGTSAALQVAGARFAAGALPPSGSGPRVASLQLSDARVVAGEQDRPLLGQLDPAATAVLVALDGDRGYWILGAGVPSTDAPTLPTFSARLGFARDLPSGTRTLVAEAVDAGGHVGPRATAALQVLSSSLPSAPMIVRLQWSDDADLDLHVIDPDGVEIWARHPSGYQPPPPPALPDPTAAMNAPLLDLDSNAGCAIDGRDQEDVIWSQPPAPGHYVVRVDAASLCGQAFADWSVARIVDGSAVGGAVGEMGPADTRGAHDVGAGRTALAFDVP